ncbi:MAG: orotate phosphoribosyltransferase [Candidatus Omnitrophica bacterium]|nr:orotate phosphoribosyltransferase [Candidatus Omnitrophota bacterium]
MSEKDVLKLFKTEKALLDGHFLLSSGLHSPNYLQCALLLQKPWAAEKLCRALAGKLSKTKIDVVIGPALGGILVSYEMGRALGVRSIFAERVDGVLTLRRGFTLKKNEKALVVEDVVTTGKSTNEVIGIVRQNQAALVGVAAIVDRSGGKVSFGAPFHYLLKVDIETYKAEECALCREGKVPLVKPGSRILTL